MKTIVRLFLFVIFTMAVLGAPQPTTEDKELGKKLRELGAVGIFGKVIQKVGDGLLVDCRQGDYQVEFTYFGQPVRQVAYARIGTATAGALVLLRDYPKAKEVADEDWIRVVGFPAGLFEYQSTGGVGKTVHAFSVAPAK